MHTMFSETYHTTHTSTTVSSSIQTSRPTEGKPVCNNVKGVNIYITSKWTIYIH